MWIRLFRYVLHNWIVLFPSSSVSGGSLTLLNSNSATTVAVRFAVWISRRISSLCDHWLGTLIPEPYYQRRFSGDRLTFKAKFSPIRSLCHYWPVNLFQVLSCFSLNVGCWWVVGLHHPLRSCRAVGLCCQTLIQHPLEQGGFALDWLREPICQYNHWSRPFL